jgi:hypothetical protein
MVQYAFVTSLVCTLAFCCASPCPLSAQRGGSTFMRNGITIRIGDRVFAATLSDNATVDAFKKLLPLTVTMTELNGNEKFAELPVSVPARESRSPSIHTGDLMLYGSSTLVLFYESFTTRYRYTKIGQVDDPAGLKVALGSGSVAVTFETKREKQ